MSEFKIGDKVRIRYPHRDFATLTMHAHLHIHPKMHDLDGMVGVVRHIRRNSRKVAEYEVEFVDIVCPDSIATQRTAGGWIFWIFNEAWVAPAAVGLNRRLHAV